MKAVILVAGESTRTRPLTLTRPKCLLPVANKPLLSYIIDPLVSRGIKDILFVVGYKKEMIEFYIREKYPSINSVFVEQVDRNGTAKAFSLARNFVDGPFIALDGDIFFEENVLDLLIEKHRPSGDCVVCGKTVDHPENFGVFEVKDDCVVSIVEKPVNPPSHLANMGIYLFNKDIFDAIDKTQLSKRGEFEITDSLQILINSGKSIRLVSYDGYFCDAGFPWSLLELNSYLLSKLDRRVVSTTIEGGATIKGNVVMGEGTVVKSGAYIEGPVVIGNNCSIGPNCYIRPETSIGDNCYVGNSCEVKGSILMNGTHIAHLCYIGDSVLGEHVNVAGGTVTANLRHDGANVKSMVKGVLMDSGRRKLGVIIGDKAKIGINNSIYPGRKIWPEKTTLPGEIVNNDVE